jgi:SMC interacting uncharacterized protein involved in chromosome segregation
MNKTETDELLQAFEKVQIRIQELLADNTAYEDKVYTLQNKVDEHDLEIQEREETIMERDDDIEELNNEINQLKEILPSDDISDDLKSKMVEYQSTVPDTLLRIEVGKEVRRMIEGVLEPLLPEGPIVIP